MLVVPTELRPSNIHGIGTFLLSPVKKGELVWVFDSRVDRIYSRSEYESLPALTQKMLQTYSTWYEPADLWIFNADNGRHFNHSKEPTTLAISGRSGFSDIIAARDLASGDELTSDYYTICDFTRTTGQL